MLGILPTGEKDKLLLKVDNRDLGIEFAETVWARQKGKKKWNGVYVNAKVLATVLSDCPGRKVVLKANENVLSAVGIEPCDGEQFFIIMPLRKIEAEDEVKDGEEQEESSEKVNSEEIPAK
jgi:hypothetical protein